MTGSRADRLTRRIAGATVAAALLVAVPAVAQQSGPVRLAPLPAPASPSTDAAPAPVDTVAPGGIVIEGLATVAGDAVGILDDASGGLGADMWQATGRADAARLLAGLPARYPFDTARALARHLLLTTAIPPVGPAGDGDLMRARVAGLVAMGAHADALKLVAAVDSRAVPEGLAAPAVAAHFLSGDIVGGCSVVDNFGGGHTDLFWQRARIVCQLAAGLGAEASLGLDLLREQGGSAGGVFRDVAYAAAFDAKVSGEPAAPAEAPDALLFALFQVAGVAPPEWMRATREPALLAGLVAHDGLDPERRLEVAHAALVAGHIGPEAVHAVYAALGADDEAIVAALLEPETVSRHRWLAYLYLAAAQQTVPIARSEALWEAWTSADGAGAFDVIARTTAPLLAEIPATPDFGWLSGMAARVALVAGDEARARDWYQLVVRQAPAVAELARAATMLWPAMRAIGRAPASEPVAGAAPDAAVSAPAGAAADAPAAAAAATSLVAVRTDAVPVPRDPVPWSEARLTRWIELAAADPQAPAIAGTLFLLERLGDPVSPAHWRAAQVQVDGAPAAATAMPGIGALAGLLRAAKAERRAETVAHALHVLGAAPEGVHPLVIGAVVEALRRVGLDRDAASMAREAMIAAGP
jgi:hypothetical protein